LFTLQSALASQRASTKFSVRDMALLATVILLILAGVGGFLLLSADGEDDNEADGPTPIPNVDLQIQSFEIGTSRPVPGEFTSVRVVIENVGGDTSVPATFEFLGNDRDARVPPINREIPPIAAGETFEDSFFYRFNWFGTFISRMLLDPDNTLIETNERNNIKTEPIVTGDGPFIINFSDALPDGLRVTESRVVTEDTFALWGFVLTTLPAENAECAGAVVWFKVANDGEVRLGTGLPDNPTACANIPLVITLLEQEDLTQEGTRGISAEVVAGEGDYELAIFADRERANQIDQISSGGAAEISLQLGPFDRQNILAGVIETTTPTMEITEIRLAAP